MERSLKMLLIILLFDFFLPSYLWAKSESYQDKNWEEMYKADKLLSIYDFVASDYATVFFKKISIIQKNPELIKKYHAQCKMLDLSQVNLLLKKNSLREEKVYVYSGFLGDWHIKYVNERMAKPGDIVNGMSEKFGLAVVSIPSNDNYFYVEKYNKLPSGIYNTSLNLALKKNGFPLGGRRADFIVGGYNVDKNLLFVDPRIKLPPVVWMMIMVHETRHSYDDIIIYKNNPPITGERRNDLSKKKKTEIIDFEIRAYVMANLIWKMGGDIFLKDWTDKGLDVKPQFATTKILLLDYIMIEKQIDKYLAGNTKPLVKIISEKMF